MADIHVLTGAMTTRNKRKVRKSYAFHFAILAIDQVVEAAQNPELVAFESVVPNIEQTELDAIKAGEIVEKPVTIDYNRTASAPDILVKVRAKYAELAPLILIEYIEKYRQYLAATTAV